MSLIQHFVGLFSVFAQLHCFLSFIYYMETVILIVCCVFVGSVSRAGTMKAIIWKKTQPGQLLGSWSAELARTGPVVT